MTRTRPLFRQWFEPRSPTYTYLLGDEMHASSVRINPVMENTRCRLD